MFFVSSLFSAENSIEKWVLQLRQKDQTLVILLVRNRFNSHIVKKLNPNIKDSEDYAWVLNIQRYAFKYLAHLSTKNKDLEKLLLTKYDLLTQVLKGEISNEEFIKKHTVLFDKISLFLSKKPNKEQKSFFHRNHKKIDMLYETLVIKSKLYATNIVANSKKEKISTKEIVAVFQSMIDNNDGEIKVVNSTYLDRVSWIKNTVYLFFTIKREELIKTVMKLRSISRQVAINLIESKEFIKNMYRGQKQSLINAWCNNQAYQKAFEQGIIFSVSMYWDDRTPIMQDLKISKVSCDLVK
jgi:hypothetical protein